ncbi:MAG: HPr kinase/phosphorylase [Candidatus Odinarchaeia archaeon]
MSKVPLKIISIKERDRIFREYEDRFLYEKKADIYGTCIKLITDDEFIKDNWEENFYSMSESVRSHGRLLVLNSHTQEPVILYDPQSKTAILFNVDYYGKIKSIALSLAGDILEDNHRIFSVHGGCIDYNGKGVAIIAPSGTGKTTHTYGLLQLQGARAVSDDWFYARTYGHSIVAFSSEKNFYIRADIAQIWPEYAGIISKAKFDNRGRAVVHLSWVIGKENIRPLTTLEIIIILKRNHSDKTRFSSIDPEDALEYLKKHNYCNPHFLVTSTYKNMIREFFFRKLLTNTRTYLVNTAFPPKETQNVIRKIILENSS